MVNVIIFYQSEAKKNSNFVDFFQGLMYNAAYGSNYTAEV